MKTVYFNGQVYTGSLPLVTAFSVENGKFVDAGSDEELLALSYDEKYDLQGKFVCCSFNDSHMHLLNYGQMLNSVQYAPHTNSLEEMLQAGRDFLAAHPRSEGQWLLGRGWNHDYFTDVHRMPNRYDMDKISTEVPIVAVRCCGHALVTNSKAIEVLGLTPDTECPAGGAIGIENGELDGRFYDNGQQLVLPQMPVPTKEVIKDYIRTACKALNSYGVTSAQTDDYCIFRSIPWQTIKEAFKEVEAEGNLTVRVFEQSNFDNVEALQAYIDAGNVTGTGTEFFKVGPLKLLGDGSLGARTAFMSEPYADDPSTTGIPIFTQEQFDALIDCANANGMSVAVHCIGDGCLDRVLNAIEKALKKNPREDHRHGIVHCQITRPDQLQKMSDLNLHIYCQSIFIDYDIHIVEDRVGKEKASSSYSWKTLMNNGLSVSNGTDCPVELPDALASMQCGITRRSYRDGVGPYLPDQAFTVQEAIDTYTIHGAESSFEESIKGKIAPGYLADFVILDQNPFEIDPMTIKDIPICATFVGGNKVFG